MKGILIYQPTSKSAPLADFIDGLDPRLREKILLRLYFLTQLKAGNERTAFQAIFNRALSGSLGAAGEKAKCSYAHHFLHASQWRCSAFAWLCEASEAGYNAGAGAVYQNT